MPDLVVTTPKRIQRKRMRGWRMPQGAVYVGRGTMWGNPFDWRMCPTDIAPPAWARGAAVDAFREKLLRGCGEHELRCTIAEIRRDLQGRDLACWCPLDHPCHADVLLALANAPEAPSP